MYLVLLLIPGLLPRYVLPLGIPLALGTAVFLEERWQRWVSLSACSLGVLSVLYGFVAVRFINQHDDLRPMAAEINSALPADAELTIYDPGYQPVLFYVREPYRYAPYLEEIPQDARFILARAKDRKKFAEKRPDLTPAREFQRKGNVELILLERGR
jgi:hypothetical protein